MSKDAPRNLAEMKAFVMDGIFEYHPLPNGEGPPTQVHLVIGLGDDLQIVVRMKSRDSCEQLVEAITKHTDNVWPK